MRKITARATVIGLVVGLASIVPAASAVAGPPPTGFLLREIPTGLAPGDLITDFTFLPDESLLVAGKYGKVTWAPPAGPAREIANLPSYTGLDLGLIGIAVAPDYSTSHVVYTARAVSSTDPGSGVFGFLRVSKWLATTDGSGAPTGLTNEQILVQTSADSRMHGLTGLVTGADGSVWISIGDSGSSQFVDSRAFRALDIDDLHGKVLRIRPDGSGVPTNPYYNAASPRAARSLVYASGLRSPFRFSLDPRTGQPVLADVGWNTWEEINIINPGNNYGWPCWEGPEPTPGYSDLPECAGSTTVNPLWAYQHVGDSSITGGVIYQGSSYPTEYRGRYFFGDYADDTLYTMAYTERGEVVTPPEPDGFATGIGLPVKFATMPTGGDIVYADISAGIIRRLVYAPGNNPPTAVITSTTDPNTRTVTLDATASTDPNSDPLTYQWNFGDGSPVATGPVVTHTYPAEPDNFTVQLTATDPLNATGSATATIYPSNHAPALTTQFPSPETTYAAGDTITASATATDAEDGPVSVSWTTVLVHCVDVVYCHDHPGAGHTGDTFEMTFEGHAGDTRLEITATATDTRGATTSRTFIATPRQRRVTVLSNSPATFTIGDQQTTSALFTVGMELSVVAPDAAQDGVATFDRWDDGSTNRIRQLTIPDADTSFTASYLTPIDRRYATDAALRAVVGTPITAEQGDSTVRWRSYTAGRVYWSLPTNVHEVHGLILVKWGELGSERSAVGLPTTDESGVPDGIGRFNHFQNGSIYYTPNTGAHEVRGLIHDKWAALGWERSAVGYPTTDESGVPDGIGRFNHFQTGSIYWTPGTGAHEVRGLIRSKWAALGWERSAVGYPTTDESGVPDGIGRFNHFQNGSIYWTNATGAHEVRGMIKVRWAALGWERSYLGYPTSDEFAIPGGRRSNFQHGYITYNFATGQTTDRRY